MGTTADTSDQINTDPLTALANTIANGTVSTSTRELLALQALTTTWETAEEQPHPSNPTSTPGPVHLALITTAATNTSSIVTTLQTLIPGTERINGSQATRSGIIGNATNGTVTPGAILTDDTPLTAIESVEQLSAKQQDTFREPLENNSFTFTTSQTNTTVPVTGAMLFTGRPDTGTFDQYDPYSEQVSLSREIRQGIDLPIIEPANAVMNGEWNASTVPTDTARTLIRRGEEHTPEWTAAAENCLEQFHHTATEKVNDFTDHDLYIPVPTALARTAMKLAVAHACLHESSSVDAGDVTTVTSLINTTLNNFMSEWESGPARGTDIDTRFAEEARSDEDTEDTKGQNTDRSQQKNVKRIISNAEESYEDGAPIDVVVEKAVRDGMLKETVTGIIEEFKQKGEVYEPSDDLLRTT